MCDYHLGFAPDGPDTFHLPHWQHDLLKYDPTTRVLSFAGDTRPRQPKTKFCAIYASHDCFGTRKYVWDIVSRYKAIDSYGHWANNQRGDNARGDEVNRSRLKLETLDTYKFNICAENSVEPWYVTEKLSEAALANTVPIYLGDSKLVESPFNVKRVLYVNELSNNQLLAEIIKLDTDPAAYDAFINQDVFSRSVFPNGLKARSKRFIDRILEEVE